MGRVCWTALAGHHQPALTILHMEAYWEKAIQGAIILLAIVAERFTQSETNALTTDEHG